MKHVYGPLCYLIPAILVLAILAFDPEKELMSAVVVVCAVGVCVTGAIDQRRFLRSRRDRERHQ